VTSTPSPARLVKALKFFGRHASETSDQAAIRRNTERTQAADLIESQALLLSQRESEIERLKADVEMAAFGASSTACYLYPEEDQQRERAAFIEGASRAGKPLAAATFDRLKASEATWIEAASTNLARAESAEARLQQAVEGLEKCRDQFRSYAEQHYAKATPEGTVKAVVNADMADMCATTLAAIQGDSQ
jgi:hypothetical protein